MSPKKMEKKKIAQNASLALIAVFFAGFLFYLAYNIPSVNTFLNVAFWNEDNAKYVQIDDGVEDVTDHSFDYLDDIDDPNSPSIIEEEQNVNNGIKYKEVPFDLPNHLIKDNHRVVITVWRFVPEEMSELPADVTEKEAMKPQDWTFIEYFDETEARSSAISLTARNFAAIFFVLLFIINIFVIP